MTLDVWALYQKQPPQPPQPPPQPHPGKPPKPTALSVIASLSLVSGILIMITLLGGVNASSLTPYPFHIPGMMGTNMMGTQNMTTQA